MCTHILEMAQKLCTKIAIVNFGRLIAEGTMADLKKLPLWMRARTTLLKIFS